ncbi:hypothetical protein C4D60_Mb05t26110 [Musa balbisiana]|uniref:Uncharacterized protein n=1 Tax=Musa balbisiana TaxID=52838 RepID=A0A4V4H8G4_MUSBA|nr:hypothetical protein C4D60_Mb05t26110 [Musa balbisiana]
MAVLLLIVVQSIAVDRTGQSTVDRLTEESEHTAAIAPIRCRFCCVLTSLSVSSLYLSSPSQKHSTGTDDKRRRSRCKTSVNGKGRGHLRPLERRPRAFRDCEMSHLARISMEKEWVFRGRGETTDALRSGFLLIPACFVCGFLCIETSKHLFCQIYLHFSSCCLSISSPDVLALKFAWLRGSKTIVLLLILVFFSFRHALSVVFLCIETLSIRSPDILAQKFAWLHGSKTIGRSGSQQQHPDLPSISERLNTSQLVRINAIDTKRPWKMLMKSDHNLIVGGQKLTAKDDIVPSTPRIGHANGLPQAVLFPYVNICIEPSSV